MRHHRLIGLAVLAFTSYVHAGTFANQYLEFLLPAGWSCNLEENTYACQHRRADSAPTDAIIILGAKVANADDGLLPYLEHLTQDLSDADSHSLVQAPAIIEIDGRSWVSAIHDGSEVPNYRTRYLATVVDGLAVVATFSAHLDSFAEHERSFVQSAYTLSINDDWRKAVVD